MSPHIVGFLSHRQSGSLTSARNKQIANHFLELSWFYSTILLKNHICIHLYNVFTRINFIYVACHGPAKQDIRKYRVDVLSTVNKISIQLLQDQKNKNNGVVLMVGESPCIWTYTYYNIVLPRGTYTYTSVEIAYIIILTR